MFDLVETLIVRWQNATIMDYAHVLLAIVIVAWFAARLQK